MNVYLARNQLIMFHFLHPEYSTKQNDVKKYSINMRNIRDKLHKYRESIHNNSLLIKIK